MTSEKQAGFSLLEVIVSTAILFSVAGAFLSMTAANGVLLTREHSLMQMYTNCLNWQKKDRENGPEKN